jgi:hypothetical protein
MDRRVRWRFSAVQSSDEISALTLLGRPGSRQAMAAMGHEAPPFPPTRLSAGCGFRKETIAGMRRNGRDAPIPVVGVAVAWRVRSTGTGPSPSVRTSALRDPEATLRRRSTTESTSGLERSRVRGADYHAYRRNDAPCDLAATAPAKHSRAETIWSTVRARH